MHIPDAVIDDPRVIMATSAIALGGLGFAVSRLKNQLRDKTTVLMGITAAGIFAAQMVNFPLFFFGAPVSGHLLGGMLSAVMLGPWGGACVIATVLIVQCLLCGDGGLSALGANFVNMGLIGSICGYAIYEPLRRAIGGSRGVLIGAMVGAWFSVLLAAGTFTFELAASGRQADFFNVLGWMVLVHAAIGVGEAVITGLVVRYVLSVRPDLIYLPDAAPVAKPIRWSQTGVAGLGIALAVAIFLAPFASEHPDGLEAVGGWFKFIDVSKEVQPAVTPLIPDYQRPGLTRWKGIATAAAGCVGTLVVFGLGMILAGTITRGTPAERGPERVAPDAA